MCFNCSLPLSAGCRRLVTIMGNLLQVLKDKQGKKSTHDFFIDFESTSPPASMRHVLTALACKRVACNGGRRERPARQFGNLRLIASSRDWGPMLALCWPYAVNHSHAHTVRCHTIAARCAPT